MCGGQLKFLLTKLIYFQTLYIGSRDYPGQQYGGGGGGGYQAPPPQQQYTPGPGYGSPPPPGPGPVYSPPPDKPRIPSGWVPQYDSHYQRWYYFEEATGRSQWEAPGYYPPGGDEQRGYGSHEQHGSYGAHDQYGYSSHGGGGGGYGYGGGGYDHGSGGGGGDPYGHHDPYGGDRGEKEKKKKSSSSGMLLGAAGGLAVGAVGGALIADALGTYAPLTLFTTK